MAQYTEGNHKGFTLPSSLTNLEQYSRVKIASNVLALAGVTDVEIGVISRPPVVASSPADVILRTAAGTIPMVAAGAISADVDVYTAANGRVASSQATGAIKIGIALTAASGAGSVIEVLRRSYEA